jgi:molybdate transport system substrate-binding protein
MPLHAPAMIRRFFALVVIASVASSLRAADLNIFAAASLSDALKEIARAYEPISGDQLQFNFAASSTLALQIKQGAPADLFFSADEAKMDELAKGGSIDAETRRSLLSNTLVIVVNPEDGARLTSPADLAKPGFGRIALAEPQTVPAGIYAKEWLQKAGLWKNVIDKIVPTENVRACLAAVESGNVAAGIVYKTDALISKKVKVAYEARGPEAPKISYPLAVVKTSKHVDAARRFADYLAGPEARIVFVKFGFLPAL